MYVQNKNACNDRTKRVEIEKTCKNTQKLQEQNPKTLEENQAFDEKM